MFLSTLTESDRGWVMAIVTDSVDVTSPSERVTLEEFRRLDLRVGEIIAVSPIPGSDRLLSVTVDLGAERRTLVAGVGKAVGAEELRGMRVVVAANIPPIRIRGVESEGMLLGVGCDDPSELALLTVNRAVPNGAVVV